MANLILLLYDQNKIFQYNFPYLIIFTLEIYIYYQTQEIYIYKY